MPKCVMGGVWLSLYGFISVSGLKMFKEVDLDDNANLLTVSSILIAGIGGLIIKIPYMIEGKPETQYIEIGSIATALLLGILVYQIARLIHYREKSRVADVVLDVKNEDYLRAYLKQFPNDRLAKVLMMFGFMHESVELTTAQLSNFLHSNEMLNLRSPQELNEIIKLFEFKGSTTGLNKNALIGLIKNNVMRIDKDVRAPYLVK